MRAENKAKANAACNYWPGEDQNGDADQDKGRLLSSHPGSCLASVLYVLCALTRSEMNCKSNKNSTCTACVHIKNVLKWNFQNERATRMRTRTRVTKGLRLLLCSQLCAEVLWSAVYVYVCVCVWSYMLRRHKRVRSCRYLVGAITEGSAAGLIDGRFECWVFFWGFNRLARRTSPKAAQQSKAKAATTTTRVREQFGIAAKAAAVLLLIINKKATCLVCKSLKEKKKQPHWNIFQFLMTP